MVLITAHSGPDSRAACYVACCALPSRPVAVSGFIGLYRVLSGFIRFYPVLSGFIRFYLALVGFTALWWAFVGFRGFGWDLAPRSSLMWALGHFSTPVPPAPGDATTTDASATETSAVPPPPPFHVPEGAKDSAPAASSPPEATVGIAHGATAAAASSAADTGIDVDTDLIPAVVAPTPPSTGIHASPNKKRHRSHGPGREAERLVFYASKPRDGDGHRRGYGRLGSDGRRALRGRKRTGAGTVAGCGYLPGAGATGTGHQRGHGARGSRVCTGEGFRGWLGSDGRRVPRARGTNGDTGRAGRGYARAKGFAGCWVATGGGRHGDENARVRVLWRVAGTFLGRVPRARGTNGDTGRAGRGYARAKGFAGCWVATGGGCHGCG